MSRRSVRADFPTGSRPYLAGLVLIESARAITPVSFLVDTGADRTTIGYADRLRLGIAPGRTFASYMVLEGVGGDALYGVEDATVNLSARRGDMPDPISVVIPILIAEDPNDSMSLLGRDVLYRFTLTMTDSMVELAE